MELNEILKIALKGGASDIHLKSGLPTMFRVDGALVPLKNGERLLPEEMQQTAFSLMNPAQKARFEEDRECDLAYGIPGLGRFRDRPADIMEARAQVLGQANTCQNVGPR